VAVVVALVLVALEAVAQAVLVAVAQEVKPLVQVEHLVQPTLAVVAVEVLHLLGQQAELAAQA
jgi:hypothetical protein